MRDIFTQILELPFRYFQPFVICLPFLRAVAILNSRFCFVFFQINKTISFSFYSFSLCADEMWEMSSDGEACTPRAHLFSFPLSFQFLPSLDYFTTLSNSLCFFFVQNASLLLAEGWSHKVVLKQSR